jgi:hypothetical protein
MGLEDIRAITLECVACSSRISFRPDAEIQIPNGCHQCRAEWRTLNPGRLLQVPSDGPFLQLAGAIKRIRTLSADGIEPGFKILIEFDAETA